MCESLCHRTVGGRCPNWGKKGKRTSRDGCFVLWPLAMYLFSFIFLFSICSGIRKQPSGILFAHITSFISILFRNDFSGAYLSFQLLLCSLFYLLFVHCLSGGVSGLDKRAEANWEIFCVCVSICACVCVFETAYMLILGPMVFNESLENCPVSLL